MDLGNYAASDDISFMYFFIYESCAII
jgi:hypothetical protein